MLAATLKRQTSMEVIFALLTRDLNRLALQSHLLGAQMLGLENVAVARGDDFSEAEQYSVKPVHDYRPTELLAAIAETNQGRDFRGRRLAAPTDFCAGATVDLGRDLRQEIALAARKVRAGAGFLITQPVFTSREVARFHNAYTELTGDACPVPVYFGLQMLEPGGISFGAAPPQVQADLAAGRSGVDLALEVFELLQETSVRNLYLLPPIRRGGERDYHSAQEFLAALRAREAS